MNNFLETTKSVAAFTAFSAVIAVTVLGVTALNPVPKLTLASDVSQVAGMQIFQAQPGKVKFESASDNIKLSESQIEFSLQQGEPNILVGQVTLRNLEDTVAYTFIKANIAPNLKNIIRVELLDEDNKILLSDFNKDFEKQKLTFKENATRTFKIKCILKSPINYNSTISLQLI